MLRIVIVAGTHGPHRTETRETQWRDSRFTSAGCHYIGFAGLDHSINARRVQAILDALPRYLPDLDPEKLELLEIWRGFRPCTPDGLPFLGRSKAHPNLTVAAGHAMIGISLAPVTGKIAAAIVSGEDSGFDLSLVGVDRFA